MNKCRLPEFRPLLQRLPLRYVIADRHTMFREGVETLLAKSPNLVCVGSTGCGDELLRVIHQEVPDIVLTGLSIDGTPALQILRECQQRFPGMGLIILSMYATPFVLDEAVRAGAHALVSKREEYDKLLDVIIRVAIGQRGFRPDNVVQRTERSLSPREIHILFGIVDGLSVEEIGKEVGISPKTVELHRKRLFQHFGVKKSTELVRAAFESGLLLLGQGNAPSSDT